MTVVKEEQHALDLALHRARYDASPLWDWLLARRAELDAKWPNVSGEELVLMQGEARGIAKLVKMIKVGPVIKTEGSTT